MTRFIQCILLISGLLLNVPLFAQTPASDMLHRLDRGTQPVLVKEVSETEVFYTEPNAPTVVRKIRKAELWKVVYSDGTSDVYNQPKINPTNPEKVVASPQLNLAPVAQQQTPSGSRGGAKSSRPILSAGSSSAGSIDVFSAGRSALSLGLDLSGSSNTVRTNQLTTKSSTNAVNLSVIFQKFTNDNISLGGGLRFGQSTSKSTGDAISTTSFIGLSGQIRRYIPVADQVAFYGFGAAELGFQSEKYTFSGQSESTGTGQELRLQGGAGLAYVFGSNWSLDFNTTLLGLGLSRYKDKSPNSKAYTDLSLTGAGVASSFSLFITRYF